jgi:hypothetical protein
MAMLALQQSAFAAALLDPGRALPDGVVAPTSPVPIRRFAVYRNNAMVSLVDALRVRFPATERIVGEEFFVAMAQLFVRAHPPRSPLMMTFGDGFADFIERFAPACELPYLADVARLEAARTRAYHAADAASLDASRFSALAPDLLVNIRVALHPSMEILRSAYPVVTIWSMNAGVVELAPIDDCDAEDALIVRPLLAVLVRTLPPGGAAFLLALASGHALAGAAERALADDARFDLTANLAGLIGAGLATDIVQNPREDQP